MRLVDMMMDYATCTVFRGQTSSMHSYRGHVTADSCYRGLYYTYIPVVSEAMTGSVLKMIESPYSLLC